VVVPRETKLGEYGVEEWADKQGGKVWSKRIFTPFASSPWTNYQGYLLINEVLFSTALDNFSFGRLKEWQSTDRDRMEFVFMHRFGKRRIIVLEDKM
jgi:hypothetical protein